jgi:20S proteasome alpha/beta subunit
MTVCIAAVCDGGKSVIVAADRMFTAPPPVNMEFETAEKKIEQVSPGCVALFAGNSAYATEIIQGALDALAGAQRPQVPVVIERLKESYIRVRNQKVRDQIIIPALGPDFVRAEALGMNIPTYLQAQQAIYGQMVMMQQQFNLGSDIVVAGVDDLGARLHVLSHPGTTASLDKLGHASIGSGGNHANMRLALGAQTKNSNLVETLYRVFDAKKAAEVAPGVGQETDIAIVSAAETKQCSRELLQDLSEIFNESGGKVPTSLEKIEKRLSNGK